MFFNYRYHLFLGVLTASEEVFLHKGDTREALGIFAYGRDICNAPDIDTAVADKDADTRILTLYISFLGEDLFLY